jgi:tetratricopeptide (TPR) repeat protein
MTQVRAFVSHSFIKSDEELLHKFVKLFNQVADLQPKFSWDRAIAAQPKSIAEKVLNLAVGKNVLICICTRRERVISTEALTPIRFSDYAVIKKSALAWKTSDWIIQETGLAMGKGMEVILFVENGVKSPGGLLSDLQFIPFDRAHPESCFGDFLEMVVALIPKVEAATAPLEASPASPPPPDDSGALTAESSSVAEKPNSGWTQSDFEHGFFLAVAFSGNANSEDDILDAYAASEVGKDPYKKQAWDAFCQWARILFGKSTTLLTLLKLSKDHRQNAHVQFYLGKAYEHFKQYADAADSYELAASSAPDAQRHVRYLCAAAIAYQHVCRPAEASAAIARARSLVVAASPTERELLDGQKTLFTMTKETALVVGTLERLLELDALDAQNRFALAFQYDELGNSGLALYHYLMIATSERTGATLNNIGFTRQKLELPARAITAYRAASERGETLAMSNLAYKYLNAGFVVEAQAICDNALAIPGYDKNVTDAASRIRELPDEEESKESALNRPGFVGGSNS